MTWNTITSVISFNLHVSAKLCKIIRSVGQYHESAYFSRYARGQLILVCVKGFNVECFAPVQCKHLHTWKRMTFRKQCTIWWWADRDSIWCKPYGERIRILDLHMRVQTKIQMHVYKAQSKYEISKRPRIHELHKKLV